MFVMVKVQGLLADVRLQRVVVVRKLWKFDGHCSKDACNWLEVRTLEVNHDIPTIQSLKVIKSRRWVED